MMVAVFAGLSIHHAVAEPAMSKDEDVYVLTDAEDLAEGGIKEKYDEILDEIRKYVKEPVEIQETRGEYGEFYRVTAGGVEYPIYEDPNDEESWGRAAVAFFDIVNRQLVGSGIEFYAVYGGNEMMGVFLTPAEFDNMRQKNQDRGEWPYRPVMEAPWYGMPH